MLDLICKLTLFFFPISFPVCYDYNGAETVKFVPQHFVAYKVFGEPGGPHFAHYDLVGGRLVCIYLKLLLLYSSLYFIEICAKLKLIC